MTTDPEEGRRQAEAMQPEPIKLGDKVRLSAGGDRVMTVVALKDYGNMVVCEWSQWDESFHDAVKHHDAFPPRSLVRADATS